MLLSNAVIVSLSDCMIGVVHLTLTMCFWLRHSLADHVSMARPMSSQR